MLDWKPEDAEGWNAAIEIDHFHKRTVWTARYFDITSIEPLIRFYVITVRSRHLPGRCSIPPGFQDFQRRLIAARIIDRHVITPSSAVLKIHWLYELALIEITLKHPDASEPNTPSRQGGMDLLRVIVVGEARRRQRSLISHLIQPG